jgi:hypothetical protein
MPKRGRLNGKGQTNLFLRNGIPGRNFPDQAGLGTEAMLEMPGGELKIEGIRRVQYNELPVSQGKRSAQLG